MPSLVLASDWRNGDAMFNAWPIRGRTITLTWKSAPDVQQSCESISKQRGLGGFGYTVNVGAFWHKDQYLIVRGYKTSIHQLGHELRHCFMVQFHWFL